MREIRFFNSKTGERETFTMREDITFGEFKSESEIDISWDRYTFNTTDGFNIVNSNTVLPNGNLFITAVIEKTDFGVA